MKNFFSKLRSTKLFVALLLVLGSVVASGIYFATTNAVSSCGWSNIVYCGLTSSDAAGLKKAYISNTDTKGHKDITRVMQWGGFNSSNITGANNSNVKVGYLTRDGVIKVGGTTVGTGTQVTTRYSGSGRTQVLPGVYVRSASQNELASEKVLVLFDSNGKATAAIIVRCGNVLKFTPVKKPSITCSSLTAALANAGVERQYNFVAKASAFDTSIYRYYFNFGDGVQRYVTTSSNTAKEQHQYAKSNTSYTATVTVKSAAGNSATCKVTVKTPAEPTKQTPGVSVSKTVNSNGQQVENAVVGVDTEYSYQVIVKNTGNVALKDVVVTDTPEAGVTLLTTQEVGTVTNNTWTTTIPSLAVGESKTFTLKAKVPTYKAGTIKNTVCVDTPTVPGGPDDCDDANVTVPKPKTPHVSIDKVVNGEENLSTAINTPFTYTLTVKNDGEVDLKDVVVTDKAPAGIQFISTDKGTITNNTLSYTIPSLAVGQSETINISAKATQYSSQSIKNTACVDTPTVPGGPDDCDDANVTVPKPGEVEVCDPSDKTIKTVPEDEADKYEPKDSDKCKTIKVCIIDDGTGDMVEIPKNEYDSSKHSTNSDDCIPATPTPPTTPETPSELPKTGPAGIIGGLAGVGALGYSGYTYVASRRALKK